jgi:hypothetical protein
MQLSSLVLAFRCGGDTGIMEINGPVVQIRKEACNVRNLLMVPFENLGEAYSDSMEDKCRSKGRGGEQSRMRQ